MVYCFEYNQRILITAPYTLEGRRYCGQLRERNAKYQKVSYKIRILDFLGNLASNEGSFKNFGYFFLMLDISN